MKKVSRRLALNFSVFGGLALSAQALAQFPPVGTVMTSTGTFLFQGTPHQTSTRQEILEVYPDSGNFKIGTTIDMGAAGNHRLDDAVAPMKDVLGFYELVSHCDVDHARVALDFSQAKDKPANVESAVLENLQTPFSPTPISTCKIVLTDPSSAKVTVWIAAHGLGVVKVEGPGVNSSVVTGVTGYSEPTPATFALPSIPSHDPKEEQK